MIKYKRNRGYFLWKPMEQVEKFVKYHIKSNILNY